METKNVRSLDPGMGVAVAKRTYLRPGENWEDIAVRVASGNCSLAKTASGEEERLKNAIAKATILPAGRHLQHGDNTQKDRNIEVFSNCSTSCSSFVKFYLLLNGSGVGRMYNDDLMLIDWRNMPDVHLELSETHKDFDDFLKKIYGTKVRQVMIDNTFTKEEEEKVHKDFLAFTPEFREFTYSAYLEDKEKAEKSTKEKVIYKVEDSREGWAKALEIIEVMTFEEKKDYLVILDFSDVRESGLPIGGMQNRPASGPAYTAYAFWKLSKVKRNIFSYHDFVLGYEVEHHMMVAEPWLQTILIDHYMSECVANGGARRSARIAVKFWKDPGIDVFINLKRNFIDTSGDSILWSSNNSVGVDKEFWENANIEGTYANRVFQLINSASFDHGTGEPGLINLDKLTINEEGINVEE